MHSSGITEGKLLVCSILVLKQDWGLWERKATKGQILPQAYKHLFATTSSLTPPSSSPRKETQLDKCFSSGHQAVC